VNKEVGSLALVGSGEYLPEMADFEKTLIDDGVARGKKPIFIQIPTAAGLESPERLQFWKDLGKSQGERLGVETHFLPIFNRENAMNPHHVDLIRESALIYLSGGDPHHLAGSLIDTPVWQAIVQAWQSGTSLAGCSAGAMVMSSHIPNFRMSKQPPTQGLSLIPDIRVIPHFNKFFKWIPDSAAKVLLNLPTDSILLGIDEMTSLVKRSGDIDWQVDGQAKVHVLKGLPASQLGHKERLTLPAST
jgi:cyanophycinase-like exopeptidase